MFEDTTNEIARTEYIYDDCLIDDEIDLSNFEFDDNDDWLYIPLQCSIESTVKDLYAWLRTEPELDIPNSKKCINTRTFTRPKKRSARINFESIFRGLSPCVTNIQKLQNPDAMHIENMEKCQSISIEEKEYVPPMLKPSTKTVMSLLSDENTIKSGQESMEAFLNMSQSKGIDSFINLGEPEFNDPLMNVSQPSILYTSIISSMSESTFTNNETMPVMNRYIMAQQVHQDDLEEKSSCGNINETFVMQSSDDVISPNRSFCTSFSNDTIGKTIQSIENINKTYNAVASSKISVPLSIFDKEKSDAITLSSTFITEPKIANLQNKSSNDVKLLDITYLSTEKDSEIQNMVSIKSDVYDLPIHANKTDMNSPSKQIESATCFEAYTEDALDVPFKMPICGQSTPINPNMFNQISQFATKHLEPQQTLYSTLKAPSLRKELLAEIRRSGEQKLDITYNHVPANYPDLRDTKKNIHVADASIKNETGILPENRYHTYRKSSLTAMINQCKNQCSERDMAMTPKESSMDRKFYTFTKKSNNLEKNEVVHPTMDNTFCKPFPKIAKKNASRMLSKLPQFLQKSNPNLVSSSSKTAASASNSTNIFSIGYLKGSQPNITHNVEKSLPNKMRPFDKLKSDSKERFLEANMNNASEFSTKAATGSTESIESIQSAHSAPDLDDRLSTCSDNSHTLYNKRTMNIEQLHQIVRMQEESLKQDSLSKPDTCVLENTWVKEETDLPSPILKNGIKHSEINTNSPLNDDLSMKCSSPLISSTESSHGLNEGYPEHTIAKIKDEVIVVEKTENLNQVVPKIENKTRLRQPINWGIGSKPSAVISGIPRPASRIPALRFAKPNAKITQTNLKKGCT